MSPASAVVLLGLLCAGGLESAASPTLASRSAQEDGGLLRALALAASLLLLASSALAVWSSDSLVGAAAGAVLLVLGGGLRAAAMRNLGAQFRTEGGADHLVVTGLHRRLRHPSELGVLAWVAGLVLAAPGLGAFALAALQLPLMLARIRIEERSLARRFGAQWHTYVRATPALLPRRIS